MSEAAVPAGPSRLHSDERLTRRAVGGDERAFAAIFRRYHQSLYRFCLAIVGNPEDAQDALQNTMVKVMRALPGEERTIALKPWLYRIAHNESIDLLRRRRETRELDVEQVAPGYGLAEDVVTRERLRGLLVDLRELPERQREVLVMREMGGLGFEEIGVALETSGAVARQTLYEARQSLRQMEEGREMDCDAVTRALSDDDGRVIRRRDVRAHLRSCAGCREFRDEIRSRRRDFAALAPLPTVAAAGMLHGLVGGGSQGATGGGVAAALGGGAAKTVATSAVVKGVATVAVVAAVGVTAADRTGAIHLGLPGEKSTRPDPAAPGAGGEHQGPIPGHRPSGGDGAVGPKRAPAASANANAPTNAHPGSSAPEANAAPGSSGQTHGAPAAAPKGGTETQAAPVGQAGSGTEKQLPSAAAEGREHAAADQPQSEDSAGKGKGKGNGKSPQAPPGKPSSTPGKGPPSSSPPEESPANPPQGAAPSLPPQAHQPTPPGREAEPPAAGSPSNPGKGAEKGKGGGSSAGG